MGGSKIGVGRLDSIYYRKKYCMQVQECTYYVIAEPRGETGPVYSHICVNWVTPCACGARPRKRTMCSQDTADLWMQLLTISYLADLTMANSWCWHHTILNFRSHIKLKIFCASPNSWHKKKDFSSSKSKCVLVEFWRPLRVSVHLLMDWDWFCPVWDTLLHSQFRIFGLYPVSVQH